jgi:hypothetical protein
MEASTQKKPTQHSSATISPSKLVNDEGLGMLDADAQ